MEIHAARREDIPAILALLRQVGQVHHHIRPDLVRQGAQKYDQPALEALLDDPQRPIFGAYVQGTMVGYAFCILKQTRDDPVMQDRTVLYVDDLCVEESCRGQGIAGQLFDYVTAFAREQGCQALTLNVWCGNDRAMAFYEKQGMKPQKIQMETILC